MDQRTDLGRWIERVTDLAALHAFREPFDELVVDRSLDEQPARRRAPLAVEAVDHEHHGIEGAIEVGVVEHDDRVLAAELEVQALQRRRRLGLDQRSGLRLTDERDGLISGCSVSDRPAVSPIPWTMFSTPAGSPPRVRSRRAAPRCSGLHSAGLCTTVHPAASAGAIFHVDSMNGVFHGVITPTGPIGGGACS